MPRALMSERELDGDSDILILRTRQTFTAYVVGLVSRAGQEDFSGAPHIAVASNQAEATTIARARISPGGTIYLFDIGTAEWAEVSSSNQDRDSLRARWTRTVDEKGDR